MLHEQEVIKVLELNGEKRYQYFIKRVADTGRIWGLYKDGWAMAGDEESGKFLPFWPAEEFASLCAQDIWNGYEPESLDIHEFLNEYLDELTQNGISPAIFYTPEDKGLVIEAERIKKDIKYELSRVE